MSRTKKRTRPEPVRPGIGPTVRRLREAAEIPIQVFAERAGLGKGALSVMERDGHEPMWGTVFRCAKALGILPTALVREWQDDFQKHPDSWRLI